MSTMTGQKALNRARDAKPHEILASHARRARAERRGNHGSQLTGTTLAHENCPAAFAAPCTTACLLCKGVPSSSVLSVDVSVCDAPDVKPSTGSQGSGRTCALCFSGEPAFQCLECFPSLSLCGACHAKTCKNHRTLESASGKPWQNPDLTCELCNSQLQTKERTDTLGCEALHLHTVQLRTLYCPNERCASQLVQSVPQDQQHTPTRHRAALTVSISGDLCTHRTSCDMADMLLQMAVGSQPPPSPSRLCIHIFRWPSRGA